MVFVGRGSMFQVHRGDPDSPVAARLLGDFSAMAAGC